MADKTNNTNGAVVAAAAPAPTSTAALAHALATARQSADAAPAPETTPADPPAEGQDGIDAGETAVLEAEAAAAAAAPAEATETEAETEANAEDGELDTSEVAQLTADQAAHVGELFKTRLGKVIARERGKAEELVATERTARETAEQQTRDLQAQLDQARQNPAASAAPANVPLGDVANAAQLGQRVAEAREVKRFAQENLRALKRNPDQVEAQLKALKVQIPDYSPEGIEDYLSNCIANADDLITVHAPARQEFLQQEAKFEQQALREFPFLKDPKSAEYADAMGALNTVPEIRRHPHYKLMMGVYAEGLKVVKARQAAAAGAAAPKPLARTVPPRVAARPGAAAPRTVAPADQAKTAARDKFAKTGSVEALAQMLGSSRS